MRLNVFFTFIIFLGLTINLTAQDVSPFDLAINEIQKKMQAIDSEFTSIKHVDNPNPEVLVSKPELFDLVIEKGELIWEKYKLRSDLKVLIATFKTFKTAARGLELAAVNGDSDMREMVETKSAGIFEGCIRSTLEGYNLTNGQRMFEEATILMDRHSKLNDYLAKPGSVEILEREGAPKFTDYLDYLSVDNKAMIEYFIGDKMIYATILWSGGMNQLQVADKQKVLANIKKLQESMREIPTEDKLAQNYTDFTTSSLLLSQLLFNHPLNTIPDSITSIVIIPDGEINAIPFDLLLTKTSQNSSNSFALDDNEYVMENYFLSYAKSSQAMILDKISMNEEALQSKMNEKLDVLKDPTKNHPSQWTSLLPAIEYEITGMPDSDNGNKLSEKGNNKMIYFGLGLLAAIAVFFFTTRKSRNA